MDDRLAEAVEPLAQAARGLPAHAAAHTNLASTWLGSAATGKPSRCVSA